jgi:hypothetical protein
MVSLAVSSCSGLFVDAELGWDIRTVTFTTCTLANTINAVLNEFSGTYRSELRWMVVKARRRGFPWLVSWAEEPWPPSYGDGLACSSAVLTLGVGPAGGVWPSYGPFAGGVDPPCVVYSLLLFQGLSM